MKTSVDMARRATTAANHPLKESQAQSEELQEEIREDVTLTHSLDKIHVSYGMNKARAEPEAATTKVAA